jgi:hypothetical protein
MDKTYLDFFNSFLKQFLNELVSYFPFTKKAIVDNYRGLLEGHDKKSDLYVKYFVVKVNNYLTHIAKKDESLYEKEHLYLIEGVDMSAVWKSPESNPTNRQAIWKYLQLLTLLGRKVVPSKQEIVDMMNKVGGVINAPTKVEEKPQQDDLQENSASGGLDMGSLLNMAGGLMGGGDGGLGGLGGLGALGGLIGGGGGEGLAGLGDMAKGLTEMMSNINLEEISKNIAEGMDQANMDGNESSENMEEANVEEVSSEEANTQENTENNGTTTNSSNDGNATGNLFNSGLFGDLAKEMSETFDFSEAEKKAENGEVDMASAFKNFMSGDNPAKLMKLVGKYGGRLQKDIASGNIDQSQLLRQTTQMMGGMEGLASQMGNMQQATGGQMSQEEMMRQAAQMMGANKRQQNQIRSRLNNRNTTTKERLQAKLAARKAAQEK